VTALPARHQRGLLATALAQLGAFFVEPLPPPEAPTRIRVRPVVAVVGLDTGCGTTTVSRALAVELARRDPTGAAAVAGQARAGALTPGGTAAGRLARAVGTGHGGRVRTVGRLCLISGAEAGTVAESVRSVAPLVLDLGHGEPAGIGAALADYVVLVAPAAGGARARRGGCGLPRADRTLPARRGEPARRDGGRGSRPLGRPGGGHAA
jgi:hypothetical protein